MSRTTGGWSEAYIATHPDADLSLDPDPYLEWLEAGRAARQASDKDWYAYFLDGLTDEQIASAIQRATSVAYTPT
jgi:hypothetical protein